MSFVPGGSWPQGAAEGGTKRDSAKMARPKAESRRDDLVGCPRADEVTILGEAIPLCRNAAAAPSGRKPFRLRIKLRRTIKSETSEALVKEVGLRLEKVRSGVVRRGPRPAGHWRLDSVLLHTFAADSDTHFISKTRPKQTTVCNCALYSSGSGRSLVSGRKGKTTKPSKSTRLTHMPAVRKPSMLPPSRFVNTPIVKGAVAAAKRPKL
jgi:hypothetical protein